MTPMEMAALFQPVGLRAHNNVKDNNIRFVHYTSADTGIKILRARSMWLRNSGVMNDFSEVQHGLACLKQAWAGAHGDRLKAALNSIEDGLHGQIQDAFNEDLPHVENETYLTSISEHDDSEDIHGRLSMWRAYAPKDGIAFVFNNKPFVCEANPFNAFSSPVNYADAATFNEQFSEIAAGIEQNVEPLKLIGAASVHAMLLSSLRFAVQATKHPAFREEREWRVLYSPTLLGKYNMLDEQQMARLPTEILTVGTTPQRIYKIPFQNFPEEDFVGATFDELIDRVLIGPSIDALLISRAIISELISAGVTNAANRVFITGIPLRH